MKIATQDLISNLKQRTESLISRAQAFKTLPLEKLNYKLNPEKWSVLECIAHLNLYHDFYNIEIRKSINNSSSKAETIYKAGFLGNYFINSMLPKDKLNKMKTFKDKDPKNSQLEIEVIEQFITYQREFLELLDLSKTVNISKTRTPITISKMIRLKLGDTFGFNIAHNERHLLQAEKATNQ